MTEPEPLSAAVAHLRRKVEQSRFYDERVTPVRTDILVDVLATIDALTVRADAAEQQAVANDVERAGWQATAEAAETALAEAVELLRGVRDNHHVMYPCDCEICEFLAAWDASEDES